MALADLGHRAILVTAPANIRYLSGFSGSAARLWVDADRSVLITDARYTERATSELGEAGFTGELHIAAVSDDPATLRTLMTSGGPVPTSAFVVEADHLTLSAHQRLAAEVGSPLVSRGVVEALRAVKDPAEVARIEAAAGCADRALAEVLRSGLDGGTEAEVSFSLQVAMRAAGADGPGYEPIVASGPRAAIPHHDPGTSTIRSGDIVIIDVGAMVEGYRSDMTRTFLVGDVPDDLVGLVKIVSDLAARGRALVAPGVPASAVDAMCRSGAEQLGLVHEFLHATGHGVGLDIHEEPPVRPTSAATLQPGHVLTVEPGLYRAGLGGARVEDTMLVTADGCRPLTSSPRQPFLAR